MHIDRNVDLATMALVRLGGLLALGAMVLTIGDVIAWWMCTVGFIGLGHATPG